ncbi:MAG: GTP cyclohydrolase I FolE [Elusimicrobia bacterium]|nr:GTP cyclohydrolase I FolE [Elusimicrobiota bacterium]
MKRRSFDPVPATSEAAGPEGRDPIEPHVQKILELVGEDPDREGLRRTPLRIAKAWRELTSGYSADVDKIINQALFTVDYNEMVCVKDVTFYSLCEHHGLPFFGKAHVAYIPNGRVVGLSKIPRLVQVFARRLQLQERMTSQIASVLQEKLKPLGVGVVVEARHLCMEMRGAESLHSPTVTSTMLGAFQKDARTREEFLGLIHAC